MLRAFILVFAHTLHQLLVHQVQETPGKFTE